MTTRWLIALTAVALVLGCRGGNSQPDDLASLVQQCKSDVAKAANVNEAEVQVTRVEAVVWRDGSLGYPEPGMDYIQMLVEGYRITLQAGGKTYDYHTDKGKRVVWREGGGQEPAKVIGPVEGPGTRGAPAPSGQAGILYLEPIPDEPNLNSRLILMDAAGGKQTLIEACTDFAVSPQGWILAKQRTSQSSHELLVTRVGDQPRVVAKAFDFQAMAFSPVGSTYAVLVRSTAGEPFRVCVGTPDSDPKPFDWAPSVQEGHAAQIRLAGNLLLVTVAYSEYAPRTTVLDLDAQRVLDPLYSPRVELLPPAER
jgi:hypothetical protein